MYLSGSLAGRVDIHLLDMFYTSDFLSYLRLSAVYGRCFCRYFVLKSMGSLVCFPPKVGVNLFRDIL